MLKTWAGFTLIFHPEAINDENGNHHLKNESNTKEDICQQQDRRSFSEAQAEQDEYSYGILFILRLVKVFYSLFHFSPQVPATTLLFRVGSL